MTESRLYHMDDGTLLYAEVPTAQTDPMKIKLGRSCVVRIWGTTRGRGQLAIDGPTKKTTIDPEPSGGEVNWMYVRRVIIVLEKAQAAWTKFLDAKVVTGPDEAADEAAYEDDDRDEG